jgi:hypothetical protein
MTELHLLLRKRGDYIWPEINVYSAVYEYGQYVHNCENLDL